MKKSTHFTVQSGAGVVGLVLILVAGALGLTSSASAEPGADNFEVEVLQELTTPQGREPARGEATAITVTLTNKGQDDSELYATFGLTGKLILDTIIRDDEQETEPCNATGCSFDSFPSGTKKKLTVKATVSPEANPGDELKSTVTVKKNGVVGGATKTLEFKVGWAPADVSVTEKLREPISGSAKRGDKVKIGIEVVNNSGVPAKYLHLEDSMPAGLTLTAVDGKGCSSSSNAVTCSWETIEKNTSKELSVTATVDADAQAGTVTNTARVTASNDDNSDNNVGSVVLTIEVDDSPPAPDNKGNQDGESVVGNSSSSTESTSAREGTGQGAQSDGAQGAVSSAAPSGGGSNASGGGLAHTGIEGTSMLTAGLLLIGVGGLLVCMRRRSTRAN